MLYAIDCDIYMFDSHTTHNVQVGTSHASAPTHATRDYFECPRCHLSALIIVQYMQHIYYLLVCHTTRLLSFLVCGRRQIARENRAAT
jgi:hypothetical protein